MKINKGYPDEKSVSTLLFVLSWFLVGLIICFVGINNTHALEKPNVVYYYDNNGSSLNYLGHGVDFYQGEFLAMPSSINFPGSNSSTNYGGAIAIPLDTPLISGSNYSITIYGIVYNESGTSTYNSILSSKNNLGLGTNLQNAVNSYINNTNATENYVSSESNILYYNFTATTNGNILLIPFSSSFNVRGIYAFGGYQLVSNGNNLSSSQIQNITTQQTNDLKNSISNSTNTITGAISDTENNLNNSINEMGENIQQGIKDGFESCHISKNLFNKDAIQTGKIVLRSNGRLDNMAGYGVTDYILVEENTTYYFEGFNVWYTACYDKDFNYLGYMTNTKDMTTLPNTRYIRSSLLLTNLDVAYIIKGTTATEYEPYGEICSNRIDETNNQLGNLNNSLTDDTLPNTSEYGNVAGWLPAGPVDAIVNLPLSLLNSISSGLSKKCSPLNLPLPYVKKNLPIPCISTLYSQINGLNAFIQTIGSIISGFMLYYYFKELYKWVDKKLSLQDDADWGGI